MKVAPFILAILCSASLFAQRMAIPFERDSSAIVVLLRLNNSQRSLRFLFDTGADGMAIRKSLADSLGIAPTRQNDVSFVGGRATIGVADGVTVHFGSIGSADTFALRNQNIALFDEVKRGFDGIVGLNLAMRYVLSVSFDSAHILLIPFDRYTAPAQAQVVQLCGRTKLLCLPAALNIAGNSEVQGEFIFDTGARYHLIAFSPFVRRNRLLLSGFKAERELSTVSMGHATPTFEGHAHSFRIAQNLTFDHMPVTLQAGSSKDINPNAPDGSVGILLIQNFNFDVNLAKRELVLMRRGQ
jgi:hypothetical protein